MHTMIRYYTGTGNTARAMGLLAGGLAAAGGSVDLAEIRPGAPVPSAADLEACGLLVLGWPTLGFSAPAHFLRWVGRLPRVRGTRAALAATCAGNPGISLRQVEGRLRRRGYAVVSATAHPFPDNWTQVTRPPAEAQARAAVEAAVPGLGSLAGLLAGGGGRRVPVSPGSLVLLGTVAFLFRLVGRRFLGKVYIADAGCTGCGFCARTCPAGAIRMRSGRPAWNFSCDVCNRCINLCPARSIQVSAVRLAVHGGGNLALTAAAFLVLGPWGWPGALALLAGGTVVQLTAVEFLLRLLERSPAALRVLAWGWTGKYGRYRAEGFTAGR